MKKDKIMKTIDKVLKEEQNPRQVWKILDQAGLINGDNYEFDKDVHLDRETIVDLLFTSYILSEEKELDEESGQLEFLKTHGEHLKQKFTEIRKAISMQSLQVTLDSACAPSYLKGAQ